MNKICLGEYSVHTENSGWQMKIVQEDGFVSIEASIDGHCATSSADRNEILNGGYVIENGISLCDDCHLKAEVFHKTGTAIKHFSPNDLYHLINSSLEKATIASEKIRN